MKVRPTPQLAKTPLGKLDQGKRNKFLTRFAWTLLKLFHISHQNP